MPKPIRRKKSVLGRLEDRLTRLDELLGLLGPPPESWLRDDESNPRTRKLGPLPCDNYGLLAEAWKKAMRWRWDLDCALTVMLAVVASTKRQGDQLWMRVIGAPGSGKTRLCDALATNTHYCYPLGQQRGFYSGYQDGSGEDYSLLARSNNMTWISPEGDELLTSPLLGEILGQGRRIYDGTATSSYKNIKEDRHYDNLRVTWIIGGTSSLRRLNRSNLGDRFIDLVIERPSEHEERNILWKVANVADQAFQTEADGQPGAQLTPEQARAYQLTAGYVSWLRENVDRLSVGDLSAHYKRECIRLAELASFMRSRPDRDADEEHDHEVEMATRLTSQFIRLTKSIPIVLNRKSPDEETMRMVRKVARDTSSGLTFSITRMLYQDGGLPAKQITLRTGKTEQTIRKLLYFLKDIGVVRPGTPENRKGVAGTARNVWHLTYKLRELVKVVGS